MNKVILYMIRHGKTICNERRLYCGKSDVELSDIGREELKEFKKNVNYPNCNLNYTSGAIRANETFNIIYNIKKFKVHKGLMEYDFGDFEMKSYEMLKENEEYTNWIMDNSNDIKCPNGESKREFRNRIAIALEELLQEIVKEGENEAVVIAHGGTIGIILELFSQSNKSFYELQPECGRGYKVEVWYNNKDIKVKIIGVI